MANEIHIMMSVMDPFERSGFFCVFKPVGMTSHDVVAYVKRRLRLKKCGHAGTLDPAACGVLVLLANSATKLSQRAMGGEKRYRAQLTFGLRTDTGDVQGRVVERAPAAVDEHALRAALPEFTGDIMQRPPMASAVKVHGKRLYRHAREGQDVERPPRQVTVHALDIVDFMPHAQHPRAVLDIRCGAGTYVRSLAEDLAATLGTTAVTSFLLRMAVGPFLAENARPPSEISPLSAHELLLPPDFLDI